MLSTLSSFVAIAVVSAPPLVATFESSVESWTIQTRSNPTGSFGIVGNYSLTLVASGGDPGGYVQELDPDNQWSFFRAPDSWMGDRSQALGSYLSFSIRTDALSFPDGRLVVLIGSDGQRISYDTGMPPLNTWTRRQILLDEGGWRIGSSASGAVATQAQILAVLGDLEHMLIGMEFGGDLLEELVGLDSVYFGHCIGDTNLDGILSPADFSAWIAAFNAGAPECDQNGDGLCTPADFSAWIANFNAGC